MSKRTISVLAAAGLLAVAAAAPTSAQDGSRTVEIPAGEPIRIATFGVISGPDASLGQDWLYTVEIAANDRGNELLGHPLQIVPQDALCTPEGGAQAALAIASDPTIVGVIGSACSDETVAGIQSITEAGLTTISPSATRPSLTEPDRGPEYAGFLRTALSDTFQGPVVANFTYDQGFRNVATIHDGSAYAEALVGTFTDRFKELGGTITKAEAVTKEQNDMGPVLTSIAADSPDALYFPIFTQSGGFIVDQIRDIEGLEDTQLIGSDGLFGLEFVQAAGPDVEGMYLSGPDIGAFSEDYPALVEKYLEYSGLDRTLQAFHAHGYDAANMMLDSIEAVAVDDGEGNLSVDLGALRDQLYSIKDYEGMTGTLSCDEFGSCASPAVALYQIQADTVNDGVWPPTYITAGTPD